MKSDREWLIYIKSHQRRPFGSEKSEQRAREGRESDLGVSGKDCFWQKRQQVQRVCSVSEEQPWQGDWNRVRGERGQVGGGGSYGVPYRPQQGCCISQ